MRLVLVYLPLVALPLGFLLQQLIDKRQAVASSFGKTMLILLPCLVLLRTLSTENNFFTTVTNLTRDRYHGYPDEWRNYALVSAWAGEHIDSNKNILCRKAGLSTVYGGRQFEGLSRFVHDNPDSADQLLFRKGIDYVILDNLNMPTVKRLLSYYLMKYPLGLKVVYTQGQRNASSLLEVIRTPPADDSAYFERVGAGLRIMPEASYFHVLAADKYQSLKDFPRAVQFYSSALQVAQTVAEKCAIRLNRGKVFLQLREVEKARKDFNTVLSYNPNDPEAIRALNVIDRLAEQTHRIK